MILIAWIVLNKRQNPANVFGLKNDEQPPIFYKRRIALAWSKVQDYECTIERVAIVKTPLPTSYMTGKSAVQKRNALGGGARKAGSSLRRGANYERTLRANFKKRKA